MQPTSKTEQWKAHDGIILAVAWGSVTNTIVSSGEDCRYKVWDTMGRPLYSSSVHEHPISSVAWSPRGDVFAVAGYNMLRLCDAAGWSRSLDNTTTGSIYDLTWTSNGTAVAGACADGQVISATLVGRQESRSVERLATCSSHDKRVVFRSASNTVLEVVQSSFDTLTVKNLQTNSMDVVGMMMRRCAKQ